MDPAPPPPPAIPPAAQARDRAELGLAALIAAGIAAILFVAVVLPAEHGVDPSGFGRLTGIDALSDGGGELDLGDRAGAVHRGEDAAPRNLTFTFTLQGLAENEYKVHMLANQSLVYTWRASGPVNFDFHGEPDAPSTPGEFASYEDGQGSGRSGSFQAPFTGRHGWYVQNVGDAPVTVTIELWGYFEPIGLVG